MFGYETDPQGVFCRRRITVSEEAQRKLQLLNLYLLLDRPLLGDAAHGSALLSAAFLLKRALGGRQQEALGGGKYALYWQHFKNILAGSPQVVSVLPKFCRERFLQRRRVPSLLPRSASNVFHLYFQSEQVPDRSSRVRLTAERDELGTPRLQVDFKVRDADVDSVLRAHELIDAEFRRQGCGHLTYESEDVRASIRQCKAVLGHHVGTTRMAHDPAHGVVDEHCRVHGVANLFIASSSTFPTSSQANPTLTIVAFAVRLADHIKATLPVL
jgi:choline dehydrogenase-like flavoprotein